MLMLVMAVYMLICHEEFAFGKGNMMAGVHQHLVDHLDWDGKGELLDIGCGAASTDSPLCEGFSGGRDYRDGLLGSRVELCQRAV